MTPSQPSCSGTLTEREQAHALMQRMGFTFSPSSRISILSAQIYLMLAGLGLVFNGTLLSDSPSRPAFLHLFTLGFMLFLIYGLGTHMLPRFTGNPLAENRWSWIQIGLAHGGVTGYALGYFLGIPLLALSGALLVWTSLVIFTWRIWRVLWPRN